jgi:hypothetical protein
MRYIYYILIIVLGLSAIIAYELRSKPQTSQDTALTVNERVISVYEFSKLYSSCPYGAESKSEFINDLIVKELLIQESQKQDIDKEESFRKSIQNFYEQSLTKTLMDRKFSSLDFSISDEDFNRRLALLTKRFHITIATSDTAEKAQEGKYRKSETKVADFDDLSQNLQDAVVSLSEGEASAPIRAGEQYLVIRLDKVEPGPSRSISESEKEKIKTMLVEEKKERLINEWIADLKSKATIKIPVAGEK